MPLVSASSIIRQALVLVGFSHVLPWLPRFARLLEYPTSGKVLLYISSAVLIVFTEETAAASLARILPCTRFGIAIAAMIRMTITTTRISTSEKPASRGSAFLIAFCVLTLGIAQK